MTELFHKDVGVPKGLKVPRAGMWFAYTPHAKHEAKLEGLDVASDLPRTLPVGFQVIETERQNGKITKWVLRFPLATRRGQDLVLAVKPIGYEYDVRSALVKTVWLNRHDDTHTTLKSSRYTRPANGWVQQKEGFINGPRFSEIASAA